jgi:DNA mismatch repair protein MutL
MEQYNDRIEILPPDVVEKIAAGEIIERPASVLKELIENALDSKATKIDILIEDAGFACIRITDNGSGMSPDDLQKSILRHATSKIRQADDLYDIHTMGFRGEALASISAVSRMSITSSATDDGLGYMLRCEGGHPEMILPEAHVRGTTVEVRDLFYNVPARKKFMKTHKAERIALLKLVEQLVIPFPEVHFTVQSEGKTALDTPAVESIIARITQIAGTQFTKDGIACSNTREGMEALMLVSPPEQAQARPRFQYLYVNNRRVENDQVTYAVREASAQFIQSQFRPSFFCFLTVDPSRIDVNVHPTKQQVKFEDERQLFGFIYETTRRGIGNTRVSMADVDGSLPAASQSYESSYSPASQTIPPMTPYVKESPTPGYEQWTSVPATHVDSEQTVLPFPVSVPDIPEQPEATAPETTGSADVSWNLISCYQLHSMFILAPIKNGVLIIDQHAAHERILYEEALETIDCGRSDSQQLLFPIVIELTPVEKSVVQSGTTYFNAFGFDIQDFGGNAVSISALPAFMKDSSAEGAVRDMIRYLLDERPGNRMSDAHKRFAAAFACGAAIKAGQKLSQEEMNVLLNNLFSTKNPYTCPHGRPTIVRMSLDELSRRFLRT